MFHGMSELTVRAGLRNTRDGPNTDNLSREEQAGMQETGRPKPQPSRVCAPTAHIKRPNTKVEKAFRPNRPASRLHAPGSALRRARSERRSGQEMQGVAKLI